MNASKIGSVAALVGGGLWLASVVLTWRNGDSDIASLAFSVGLAALLIASLASGYALVTTAPIWLRLVVSVCVALLAGTLFLMADGGIKGVYDSSSWLHDELATLLTAAIAMAVGFVGVARSREPVASVSPHSGGHRARQ